MRRAGLRGVVAVAVVAVVAPAALAATGAADPMRMLLVASEAPGGPYDETETLRAARLKPQVVGLAGASRSAAKAASSSKCAARYFSTDTASGEKQVFSYVCVTGSAADAKVLAQAFIKKRGEFLIQPASCQNQSPSLGQSAGLFRWCPYKANSRIWTTTYLGIWSYRNVVALYGYEYPLIENRPSLQQVLPGLNRLSARVKAAS
jgi:hypothetical protein